MKLLLTIQLATLIIAFISVFAIHRDVYVSLFATLIYMTMPYRLYVCICNEDTIMSLRWMILPLLYLMFGKLVNSERKGIRVVFTTIVTLLAIIITVPFDTSNALCSVTENGYTFGEFFSFWHFGNGVPGIGFGAFISVIAIIWLFLIKDEEMNNTKLILLYATILTVLSTRNPLWDFAERVHPALLKVISYIGTPAFLFGVSMALSCIPCAIAQKKIVASKRKYISVAEPCIMVLLSVVSSVYIIINH